MEKNIAISKRDHFGVTRALVPCAGFKLAAPPLLRKRAVRTVLTK